MNEVLADLYADTGDRALAGARRTSSSIAPSLDPLSAQRGSARRPARQHAVPKLLGSARTLHRTPATRADGAAAGSSGIASRTITASPPAATARTNTSASPTRSGNIADGRTAETCNVYNMLKMTRRLFSLQPDIGIRRLPRARAVQPHPRIDRSRRGRDLLHGAGRPRRQPRVPGHGAAASPAASAPGMESHALHGDGLYYESGDRLWVNLYAPSTAVEAAGVKLSMDTRFPRAKTRVDDDGHCGSRRRSRSRCGGRSGRATASASR